MHSPRLALAATLLAAASAGATEAATFELPIVNFLGWANYEVVEYSGLDDLAFTPGDLTLTGLFSTDTLSAFGFSLSGDTHWEMANAVPDYYADTWTLERTRLISAGGPFDPPVYETMTELLDVRFAVDYLLAFDFTLSPLPISVPLVSPRPSDPTSPFPPTGRAEVSVGDVVAASTITITVFVDGEQTYQISDVESDSRSVEALYYFAGTADEPLVGANWGYWGAGLRHSLEVPLRHENLPEILGIDPPAATETISLNTGHGMATIAAWPKIGRIPNWIVFSPAEAASFSVDANSDGAVDGADFLAIQRTDPALISAWQAQFGEATSAASPVPEPSGLLLTVLAAGVAAGIRLHRRDAGGKLPYHGRAHRLYDPRERRRQYPPAAREPFAARDCPPGPHVGRRRPRHRAW